MDVKHALTQVFTAPLLKKIPGRSLVAATLAAIVQPALAAAGFELPAAAAALLRSGFVVGEHVLPSLVAAARQGAEALGDWMESEMGKKPEVNEAAAQTLVEQAPAVADALQEARPDDKAEVADTVREGLTSYGGASAEIAEQYAAAMKDAAELRVLMEQMQAKIKAWASQTVEAKQGSLIENVEQHLEGKGQQQVRADDDSLISGVKQTIRK